MDAIKLKYTKAGMLNKHDAKELHGVIIEAMQKYEYIYLDLNNSQVSIEFLQYLFYPLWETFWYDLIIETIKIKDSKIIISIIYVYVSLV